jgi:hypothetical protein
METKPDELALREYDALRREIDGYFAELRKLETYAVLATAAVYSFLITLDRQDDKGNPYSVPVWAWALPIAFPLLAAVRGWAFGRQIELIAEYLREIELRYPRENLGWEHFMKQARAQKRTRLGTSSYIFALVLGGMTVAVFVWRLMR